MSLQSTNTPGDDTMIRMLGLTLVCCRGCSACRRPAQCSDRRRWMTPTARLRIWTSPYGGFGLQYAQALWARYGQAFVTGAVWSWIGMAYALRIPVRSAGTRRAPPGRSWHAQTSRSHAGSPSGQPRYQLPTGSLDWPAASGVILYSPGDALRSYGSGYGRGPYGSIRTTVCM